MGTIHIKGTLSSRLMPTLSHTYRLRQECCINSLTGFKKLYLLDPKSLALNDLDHSNEPLARNYAKDFSSQRDFPTWLNPSSAALILIFALKEVDVPQAPPHLPADRATAVATQRTGPTIQDYNIMAAFRTPLLADSRPQISTTLNADPRRRRHDLERYQILDTPGFVPSNVFDWLPKILTGIWEGIYMVCPPLLVGAETSTKCYRRLLRLVLPSAMMLLRRRVNRQILYAGNLWNALSMLGFVSVRRIAYPRST